MLDAPATPHTIATPDDAPIFIIGTGRSGTTLLRQMMNAHPRIHITHEACFYSYARHAPPGMSASAWLERYFDTFSYAWLRLPPQAVRDALPRDLPMSRVAEAYRAIMREKARQLGKPRYGEKNPLDTQNLPLILGDFPDPRIIYITRDPRPTVQSFNRMPFGTSSKLLNCLICRIQLQHVTPYLDRILEVRLEDLTADPRTTMAGILNFVGEPWDEAVLDHVHRAPADDMPPLPWFVSATRAEPSRQIGDGGWQRQLEPAWVRLIERLNAATMARHGYAAAELAAEPGGLRLLAAVLGDVPGMLSAAWRLLSFKRKLDRHFQDRARLSPQRAMEENVRLNPAAWRHYPGFRMPEVPRLQGELGGG